MLVDAALRVRFGIIAPPWIAVPPPACGGTEAVLDTLAQASQAAGHDVPVELFSGLSPSDMAVPVASPASCSPQAWTSAAPLLDVRTLLELEPDLACGRLALDPVLPPGATHLELEGIALGADRASISVRGDELTTGGLPPGVVVRRQRDSRPRRKVLVSG